MNRINKIFTFLLGLFFIVSLQTSFALQDNSPLLSHGKTQALEENDIQRFTNAITEIKDFYVQSINDKKLLEDAIRGMLTGLDPHSEYLDEDAYKTLLMSTTGEFGGLGIEVTSEYNVLKVISPIDDTPASRAGIKAGDYIVAIDGKLVNDMTLREAVDRMRGKKGTAITLTVIRKGEKTPIVFKLTRDIIQITSVKSKLLENGYGYIRITQFQQPTANLLASTIEKLEKESNGHLNGLVIDLRNNPGGLLESAVNVSNKFIDSKKIHEYNKLIVYTEGRLAKAQYSAKATGTDMLNGAPIVVLINEGSASASEIVAGALQDYRRAVIVGTTSFGKGSVQTVLPLDDKHAIKLTTALYHTPAGRVIQNVGIIPDVFIENLKVTSNKNDVMLEPIKEFELKGHLAGKGNAKVTTNIDESNLATEDFQLYSALKILKTMSMLARTNVTTKATPEPITASSTPATTKKAP